MDLARARKILNVADSAFISMDDEGRITYWNIRAEETFGWTREQAVGQNAIELIVPERFRETLRQGFRRFKAGGETPPARPPQRAARAAGRRQRVPGRTDRLGARGGGHPLLPRLPHRHLRRGAPASRSASGCSPSSSTRSQGSEQRLQAIVDSLVEAITIRGARRPPDLREPRGAGAPRPLLGRRAGRRRSARADGRLRGLDRGRHATCGWKTCPRCACCAASRSPSRCSCAPSRRRPATSAGCC